MATFLQASHQAVQNDNAKLQVAMRTAELQEELMRQDNEELQKQVQQLDQQNSALRRDYEHLQKLHNDLLNDQELLQTLHEQLNADYEYSKRQLVDTKGKYRELKANMGDSSKLRERAEKDRRALEELKALLAKEREQKEREFKSFALLQNEHSELKREHDQLLCRCEVLKQDAQNYQNDLRRQKTDMRSGELQRTQMQGKLAELQDLFARKDLELVKCMHKCDVSLAEMEFFDTNKNFF